MFENFRLSRDLRTSVYNPPNTFEIAMGIDEKYTSWFCHSEMRVCLLRVCCRGSINAKVFRNSSLLQRLSRLTAIAGSIWKQRSGRNESQGKGRRGIEQIKRKMRKKRKEGARKIKRDARKDREYTSP